MNIIYLYSEVMGYTLSVVKELVKNNTIHVHIVYWDQNRKSKYELPVIPGVFYYKRSETNELKLKALINELNPSVVYVSGRMDKLYLKLALYAKKNKISTVTGFDNQWKGSLRNKIISLFSKFLYQRYFDYIWVAGVYQYEYAKRLGYANHQILWHVYSADINKFEQVKQDKKSTNQFVFVGRFAEAKAIDVLIRAYNNAVKNGLNNWTLLLIGNGPLRNIVPAQDNIQVYDFMQPEELSVKMKEGGVFVLPSNHEPWGVVLHEFAAAGFPIICSDRCGAGTAFVKNGYNGYVFPSGKIDALENALHKIAHNSTQEILEMSLRSIELSKSITPLMSACSLLSIIKK